MGSVAVVPQAGHHIAAQGVCPLQHRSRRGAQVVDSRLGYTLVDVVQLELRQVHQIPARRETRGQCLPGGRLFHPFPLVRLERGYQLSPCAECHVRRLREIPARRTPARFDVVHVGAVHPRGRGEALERRAGVDAGLPQQGGERGHVAILSSDMGRGRGFSVVNRTGRRVTTPVLYVVIRGGVELRS